MTELYRDVTTIAGDEIEHRVSATAGVNLSTGESWWGSRVELRRRGERRWRHFNAAGVHPFDEEAVLAAMRVYLAESAGGAQASA